MNAIKNSDIVFIAVGTPTAKDGVSADLKNVYAVAQTISKNINKFKIIITKSTVPVCTGDEVEKILRKKNSSSKFEVVSNPEFLREGEAIRDFRYPDRVVVGTNNPKKNTIPMMEKTLRGQSAKKSAKLIINIKKKRRINQVCGECFSGN
jgi:UDPglucose 6-dehydrogenase